MLEGKRPLTIAALSSLLLLAPVGYSSEDETYGPAAASIRLVHDIPSIAARKLLVAAADRFNRQYGPDVAIASIDYSHLVGSVDEAVNDMLKTSLIVSINDSHLTLTTFQEISGSVATSEVDRLRATLAANVKRGDYLVTIRLHRQGGLIDTINTVSPDAERVSGAFLGTTRIASEGQMSAQFPNTVCTTRVISTYLWGRAAEVARGCVRATCAGKECTQCKVVDSNCFPGFFGSCEVAPLVGADGTVSSSCCDGFFNYKWATGFKKIKIGADGKTLEVEGTIGHQGNGGFTATECCPVSN